MSLFDARRQFLRWAAWALVGLAALLALSWLALPLALKALIERQGTDFTGRAVTVRSVNVQPWALAVTIHDLAIAKADASGPQFAAQRVMLDVSLASVARMAPVLDGIEVLQSQLWISHHGAGRYDVDDMMVRLLKPKAPGGSPARFAFYNLRLVDGSIDFADARAGPVQVHEVRRLQLAVPFISNLDAQRPVTVKPHLAFAVNGTEMRSNMEASPFSSNQEGVAHIRFSGLDVTPYLTYLPASLPLQLRSALFDTDVKIAFAQLPVQTVTLSGKVKAQGLKLADRQGTPWLDVDTVELVLTDVQPLLGIYRLERAQADGARLRRTGQPPHALPRLRQWVLSGVSIDVPSRNVQVASMALEGASLPLGRDLQGQWNFTQWWMDSAQAPVPVAAESPAPANLPAPWSVQFNEWMVKDGTLAWDDRLPSIPVQVSLTGLDLRASRFSLEGKDPAQLELSARVRAGKAEPGALNWSGEVAWSPLMVKGKLVARNLPAHALTPYAAGSLNLEIARATASAKGSVLVQTLATGTRTQLRLDGALDDFRAYSPGEPAQDLINWKSLTVPGISLDVEPGQATALAVGEVTLADFFARIAINGEGRLNLQEVFQPAQSSPPREVPSATTPLARISVGPVQLINGSVAFSDSFIQPNYSADLTQLSGRLGAFTSRPVSGDVALAALELRGRAQGSASLDISGRLNPLVHPLALDIQGRVRDLELPPLSPYAVKYAGYGIERGKLSMDVGYTLTPEGQLTATNKLVLNQLTFGEKVDGSPANLPVKLAVALLADRNGVIDIDLPVSGSLNDPQFSLGPVIWKVVTNLVTKALTAPFSLLTAALGPVDESGKVRFAPGSSTLSEPARQSLSAIARALQERPALSLTVVGTANLASERAAMQAARLQDMLLAEKRRRVAAAGQDAGTAQVSDAETTDLLTEVYRRAEIAKPRTVLGLALALPVGQMRALLLDALPVNETHARELALARGVVVRDYLVGLQVPAERLFLGAPSSAGNDPQLAEPIEPYVALRLSNR